VGFAIPRAPRAVPAVQRKAITPPEAVRENQERSRGALGVYAVTSPRSHPAPLSTDNLAVSRAREVTQSSQQSVSQGG
jgi:hypothetical protein